MGRGVTETASGSGGEASESESSLEVASSTLRDAMAGDGEAQR